ncbi:pyruvate formate lyase family protein [Hymenobacter cellulosilyticus]|uniref:Pyruvate formate lyase family protein n=1 Tax=Hymenobacter cellulosilyticus TaxID=2932248 RepID=A0A8T9QGK3_9BACT|nr:pyruvate formate lyase family protein [Hymenobacter cellulosilyticus]UOQ75278.1 pyruvate formate lyase family protein [Hymenobacter cellulosilyticus]
MTGISTAADSLYVIRQLVFGTKEIRLDELVTCLATNWAPSCCRGKHEQPAFGLAVPKTRIDEIKTICRAQPSLATAIRRWMSWPGN